MGRFLDGLAGLGAGLAAAGGDRGPMSTLMDLREQEQEETNRRLEREDQATEVQRKVFASLYGKAIENGADDDVIQRLESGLGVQIPEGIAGGIGSKIRAKAELDSKRKDFHAILKSGTFTPGSISKAISSGFDISLLEQDTQTQNNRVLGPGGQLVDPSGKVLATNPNMRQPAGPKASFKEKLSGEMEAEFESLKSEVSGSPRLSDKLRLAEAKTTLDVARGIMTPSAGDKRKAELGRQFETLARFDNSAETALNILREDQTAATVTADMARAIRSTATNAKSLFNLIPGVNIQSVELDESGYSGKLAKYAGDNNQLRSVLFNVALLKAAANGLAQGKISNQMISMMIDDVGASARSPQAIARKLEETRGDLASALEISTARTLGDFGRVDQDPTQPKALNEEERSELEALRRELGQ